MFNEEELIQEEELNPVSLEEVYKPVYTLKFSNGLVLSDLYLNGNNFVSETQVIIPNEIFSSI